MVAQQKNLTAKPLHIHDAQGNVHMIPPGCPIPEWATPPIKTQSLEIQTHFPILKPMPAPRILDPNEAPRPGPITVTGNNVPAVSRAPLNKIDRETARVITRGRVLPRPNPEPNHASGEIDTEALYQAELAELRRKYGYAPDGDTEN